MTISSTVRRAGPHIGNGVTTAFSFAFKVFTSADVLVVQTVTATGVDTTKTLTTDYTVTLNADQNVSPGGTVTMLVAPPTGTTLVLGSQVANLQPANLSNGGGFYPSVINDGLDRAVIQIQQLAEGADRSLKFPIGDDGTASDTIPSQTERASTFLAFDASGNPISAAGMASVPATAYMATVLDDETAQAARNTLGIDGLGSAFRNRIINGAMLVAQRGTSATVTAGTAVPTTSAGYPCIDRWFVYSTGANVTAAQVGSGLATNRLQITGAASVTAVGVGQRIEQANSADLAGQTVTLSVDLANSLLTTVTWTASYANSADAFGTIGTPTKTQIATGTFTVDTDPTRYSAQITLPAGATTGIEILFTVGAQVSGTWTIGNVQIERGTTAGVYDPRPYGQELSLCQRYLPAFLPAGGTSMVGPGQCVSTTAARVQFAFPVTPRVVPTGISATAAGGFSVVTAGGSVTCTSIVASTLGHRIGRVEFNVAAGLTAGQACEGLASSTSSILFTGCELP